MKQAEWNGITWGFGNHQLAMIKNIRISQGLNFETQESENGENKTIIKGLNPEELSIQYSAGFAVGLDPRGEFNMLKEVGGQQDNFYLNGTPVGVEMFGLDEVQLSGTVLDNTGKILAGDITLNFNSEKVPSDKGGKGAAKKSKTGTNKQGKKSSLSLKREILNS